MHQRNSKDTPMAHQSCYLLMVLGKAVREPMLHLLCNVNQRRFGGMFRELVGLADVNLATSPAQTVQQEGFHLHVADEVNDGSDLRFTIEDVGNASVLLGGFRATFVFERDLPGFLPATERHDRVVVLGVAEIR